ncbi:D-alanyl-D-alanine carboxypeptidase/D-alanyl-D-alanine-endopeptidase [Christiangramia sp.]|uniref:D-alanyl-D-alanine carboxypeptidase/D-alanyl-D-alanine endopeptidase n=1 Tax=Christiangramia sp. TaxID=1931228 RepID=UPI0026293D21|nr:D-alanyl-D-alanine carboxypeptidase/D-alanyl-D-alanine-endopeptidase [Christiangramia sp.]
MNPLITRYALILALIGFISCSPSIEKQFKSSKTSHQGFTGLAVYDLAKEKMLYEYNSDKYFTPASNTKLFTFYTGLKILGDSVPAVKYAIRGDSLIFKGTGDPSLMNPALENSKVLELLSKSHHNLYYYPPVFTEEFFGPGWSWDDYHYAFSAERSVMPVFGNKTTFYFNKNTEPQIEPKIFRDSISYSQRDLSPGIQRNLSNNNFQVSENYSSKKNYTREVPFKYSDRLLLDILEDTLKKKIELIKNPQRSLNFNKILFSIPIDSIYKKILEESDNFIAEQILLMAAGKISDTLKTSIAIDYMKQNYLKDLPDKPVWVDGSGLSRYNLFTPRSLVKLLEKIYKELPQKKLFSMMATGGTSGTLKNYYKAETPYIFAKTGTLSNNHSLSGYLKTESGKILIFSFMNSNYTIPTSELKEGMTEILEKIRDHY